MTPPPQPDPARLGRWIFRIAGIWGLLVVTPMYFLEHLIGQDQPPAITHLEFFYGFIGVTLAWQMLFLIIASDPIRFRPAMLAAMIEKVTYAVAVAVLFAQHRVAPMVVLFAGIDAVLLVLFILAYQRTGGARPTS
jgi:hypothetical protein